MNFKTTIVLILCLVIAGVALYFTRNQPTTEAPAPTIAKLIDLPMGDVTRLTVTPAADKQIVFEKQGTKWQMTAPVNAAADAGSVEELVSSLTSLESHGKTDASGANAEVTGIGSPRYQVEIVTKDGKTTKLAVGRPTGVGDELYVQKASESQADRVASSLYSSLNKPVSSFRDLKLLDVKSPEVKDVNITTGSGSFSLNRRGNNWQVATGPTTMPADDAGATDVAIGLTGLRATEFVAEKADDLKRYGLDEPQVSLTFTVQPTVLPGATQPSTQPAQTGFVKFGRYQDLRKQNVFAMTSASPAIAIVPVTSMTTFDKKPIELRDKNVLKIDKTNVDSITIETNKPATTQPTTKPSSKTLVTLKRNKEALKPAWHAPLALPDQKGTSAQASTAPTTSPTTVASTELTTQPATQATAIAPPPPKWEVTTTTFEGDVKATTAPGDESAVDTLLGQLAPFRVEKFLDKAAAAQATVLYTISITTPTDVKMLTIVDPGGSQTPVGEIDGLSFEINRAFLDRLTAKYTGGGASNLEPSPTPAP